MVTLPVGPLPHKEVLGLYIRAWLSKITAVLLPWLSGAMTFQRIWNRLQLVRFKVETFTTAVVIEPVIVCNSGRSSFQHVPTCSNSQVCWWIIFFVGHSWWLFLCLLYPTVSCDDITSACWNTSQSPVSCLMRPEFVRQRWPKVARWQFWFLNFWRQIRGCWHMGSEWLCQTCFWFLCHQGVANSSRVAARVWCSAFRKIFKLFPSALVGFICQAF